MSDKIKTRDIVKGIKVNDKAGNSVDRMRNAFIRTKDEAEHTQQSEHSSPAEYASDNTTRGAENLVYETGHQLKKQTGKIVDQLKNARNAKRQAESVSEPIKEQAQKYTHQNMRKSTQATKQSAEKTIKTAPKVETTIKQSAKATGKTVKVTAKRTIKTTQKTVKSAEYTAKATIKTFQQTAKVAAKTTQATAKATNVAIQSARVAVKAAAVTTKAVVKATVTAVKAIIAAVKGLGSLIAAGGLVAIAIILLICLFALILSSGTGVFFSSEQTTPQGRTMTQVISELNTEFNDKIEEIKSNNPHDRVEIISVDGTTTIKWDEVLSVYAVKTASNSSEPTEVVTIDDSKVQTLQSILWKMTAISPSFSTVEKERTTITTDVSGKEVTTTETVIETILTIAITHKGYLEMASEYVFNAYQIRQLNELMCEEYSSMWRQLIGGNTAGNG